MQGFMKLELRPPWCSSTGLSIIRNTVLSAQTGFVAQAIIGTPNTLLAASLHVQGWQSLAPGNKPDEGLGARGLGS